MVVLRHQGCGDFGTAKKRLRVLAEYLLGENQPQPIDSIISIICDAFHCTPPVARTLDLREVRRIMDIRLLESAKEQHNADNTQMSEAQTAIWMEAMEALNG